MPNKPSLSEALKWARQARGLSQEAFSGVSSRTYLSSLERGMKSPTLSKIKALCRVLRIHPVTLLTMSFTGGNSKQLTTLQKRVRREIASLRAPKSRKSVHT